MKQDRKPATQPDLASVAQSEAEVHIEQPPAESKALAPTATPSPPLLAGVNIEALLEKAVDAKSAVEVIERLQVLRKELRAEQAQAAFDEALSEFQAECPAIVKTKGVPDKTGNIAYKYAPIELIEAAIRPLLRKHGFTHTFDTDTSSQPSWVIAKCLVTHKAGHSRVSTAKFPLGTKTGIMSDTQVYAAALTFANRRALCNAYGLVLAGEDNDGAGEKPKPTGPSTVAPSNVTAFSLAKELWNLLKPVCQSTEQNWNERNQWLWKQEILDASLPESAPDLSIERFKQVIAKAKEALR